MQHNRFQIRGLAAVAGGRRFVALRAGWGAGKSRLLGDIALLRGETSGADVLWVTDTHGRISKVVLPVCEEVLAPAGWKYRSSESYWHKGKRKIWLSNYYRPQTRDATSSSAEGSNQGTILVDEGQAFRDDEVLRKLTGRSRVKATLPPLRVVAGLPVLNAWWEEQAKKAGRNGAIVHGTSYDNREWLAPEWFEDALATLGRIEFEAMLLNKPRPPSGQVYDCWRDTEWPNGNLIDDWRWRSDMRTVLAIDFGLGRPAVIALAYDWDLGQWVAFAEICPTRPTTITPLLCEDIRRLFWPREFASDKPADVPFLFDEIIGDPAGRKHHGDTGRSDLDILGEDPPFGLGVRPFTETDPAKQSIRLGVVKVRRAMERAYSGDTDMAGILITRELWDEGLRAPSSQRTLAKSILGYRYPDRGGDEPFKDRINDHFMDALRYFVRWLLWYEHPHDGRIWTPSAPWSPVSDHLDDQR